MEKFGTKLELDVSRVIGVSWRYKTAYQVNVAGINTLMDTEEIDRAYLFLDTGANIVLEDDVAVEFAKGWGKIE